MEAASTRPALYSCPITLQPIVHPVIDPTTGQLYERHALVRWVRENGTSPLSRLPLSEAMLDPTPDALVDDAALATAVVELFVKDLALAPAGTAWWVFDVALRLRQLCIVAAASDAVLSKGTFFLQNHVLHRLYSAKWRAQHGLGGLCFDWGPVVDNTVKVRVSNSELISRTREATLVRDALVDTAKRFHTDFRAAAYDVKKVSFTVHDVFTTVRHQQPASLACRFQLATALRRVFRGVAATHDNPSTIVAVRTTGIFHVWNFSVPAEANVEGLPRDVRIDGARDPCGTCGRDFQSPGDAVSNIEEEAGPSDCACMHHEECLAESDDAAVCNTCHKSLALLLRLRFVEEDSE